MTLIFVTNKRMFIVQTTYRAHSSGDESSGRSSFQTLDDAVNYITNDWYTGTCTDYEYPEMWDAEDMGMSFPTKDEFTQMVKEKLSNMKRQVNIFAPYSDYCALVPLELTVYEIK